MKKRKNHALYSFSAASFLNDVGADMVRPFWPLFITTILGAPASFLGFVDGIGDSVAQSVKFPAGYLSDKLKKRKIFIWLGYLIAGFARIGYAISLVASWLIPFKIMDRMGKMRDPSRDAMLSDITKKRKRGKVFGILTAADNFGSVIGPIIALFLILYIGYRELFFLAAIPSFIGAFVIYKFVKEEKISVKIKYHFNLNKLSVNYKLLLLSASIFSLSWFSLSFMVLFVSKTVDIVFLPLLFITMAFFASLISIPSGYLSDRCGRKPVLFISYILFSIVCIGFIFFDPTISVAMSFALFALYGVHYGMITTVQRPFVSDLSPKNIRASAIGLYQTTTGIILLPASLIAGLLWDVYSPATTFLFGFSISILGAFVLLLFVKESLNC